MEYPNYKGVEYKPDGTGIPEEVKCPLIDAWLDPGICMRNQAVSDEYIPEKYKKKKGWRRFAMHVHSMDINSSLWMITFYTSVDIKK